MREELLDRGHRTFLENMPYQVWSGWDTSPPQRKEHISWLVFCRGEKLSPRKSTKKIRQKTRALLKHSQQNLWGKREGQGSIRACEKKRG